MKIIALVILIVCAVSATAEERLPSGYSQASQLTSILASEPSVSGSGSSNDGSSGTISFSSGSSSSSSSMSSGSSGKPHNPEIEEIHAEYDSQIDDIKKNMKKVRVAIKETEECARRLNEQKAQLRSMLEQKEHLEKEREKAILEAKLRKQMQDLAEINHMSRTLRSKFSELKRTQQLIKTRMQGTRSSLNQIESDPGIDLGGLKDSADKLGSEMDAMHLSQKKILHDSHKSNKKRVKLTLKTQNSMQNNVERHAEAQAKALAEEISQSK